MTGSERSPVPARWLVRGLLAATGVASCICSTANAPSRSRAAAPEAAQPTPAPVAVKPESLTGNWLFAMKAGGRSVEGSIHFTVVGGVLAGSLTGSDGTERELSNIKLDADRISWDLGGERSAQHAEGRIEGGSMKGTMKWKRASSRGGSRGQGSDEGSDEAPPPSGGGGGFRGGRGRGGGRGGSGGRASEVAWTAYKTVAPLPEQQSSPGDSLNEKSSPAPTPRPTPGPGR